MKPRIFDVEALYTRLDKQRRARRLRWRDVAKEAGVVPSTFSRMGVQSLLPNGDNLARLLLWLGDTDLKPYIVDPTGLCPSTGPADTEEGAR